MSFLRDEAGRSGIIRIPYQNVREKGSGEATMTDILAGKLCETNRKPCIGADCANYPVCKFAILQATVQFRIMSRRPRGASALRRLEAQR